MHREDTAVREDGVIDEEDSGILGQLAGEAAAGRVEVEARAHALLHALQRLPAQACNQCALPEPARRHIPVPQPTQHSDATTSVRTTARQLPVSASRAYPVLAVFKPSLSTRNCPHTAAQDALLVFWAEGILRSDVNLDGRL